MSSLTVHFFFDKARFIFHYTKEFTLGRGRAGKLQTFLNSLFSLISSHHSLKKISQFDMYLKRSFLNRKIYVRKVFAVARKIQSARMRAPRAGLDESMRARLLYCKRSR